VAIRFCPKCGSSAVTFSGALLVHADTESSASCDSCGWQGKTSNLLTSQIRHNQGSDEQLLEKWSSELRNIYAKVMGPPLAKFLAQWGFLGTDPAHRAKLFALYVAAMGSASAHALLETRKLIALEGKAPADG
jgi:hypothetical protein